MSTKKPLNQMVNELLAHINIGYQNQIIYNNKLMQIYQGNLMKFVEESMQLELNARAFERSKGRIAPINILNKVIDKLSRVYTETPCREAGDNEIDNQILDYYVEELELDKKMALGNELLNLHKCFALEMFLEEGEPDLRVLPADKFLVYSDSDTCPNELTVFIKFMGNIQKQAKPVVDRFGKVVRGSEMALRDVALFHIYSDEEFMILDHDGEVHEFKANPYGIIPFVYCNSSAFQLMPTPDSDMFQMAVLIPKMLADVNYALQFMSHSIVYGIDIEVSNLDSNPDSFWSISSIPGEGKSPTLGTIKPESDSDKALALITAQLGMWLDSKGIKTGTIGTLESSRAASGISKMIDEGDASAITKKQTNLFLDFEADLWELITKMHHYWVSTQQLNEVMQDFSLNFEPSIEFEETKVFESDIDKLNELKIMNDLGLFTPRQALIKLNPEASSDQIDSMLQDIQDYKNGISAIQQNKIANIIKETPTILEE